MIKIGVIDADQEVHTRLEFLFRAYFLEKGEEVQFHHYYYGKTYLLKADQDKLDVLVLDIQLPDCDGFEVAKKFRQTHTWQPLLLCAQQDVYAISGYYISAIGFVLKPLNDKIVNAYIEKIYQNLLKNGKKELIIRNREECVKIPSDNILYIEIKGHVIQVHYCYDGQIKNMKCRGTLSEYEKILEPCGFARCCVYALVNMKHVTSVKGTEIHLSKLEEGLPLSRSNRNEFLACFASFLSSSVIQAA